MNCFILLAIFATFLLHGTCKNVNKREILATLDDANLQKLDLDARREILLMIVKQINQTAIQQKTLSKTCETKINASVASCKTCNADLCVPQPPPLDQVILASLASLAYEPVLAAGKFVDSIGKGLDKATTFLGKGAGNFVKELGSVSKSIGSTLKDGTSSALSNIASGFEKLGSKFTDLGHSISSGATDALNNIQGGTKDLLNGLGSEFSGLTDQLGSGLGSLGSGLTDLGNKLVDGVKNVGSQIGHTFGHIFGRRCVQSCPVCDQLDVKTHSKEDVLKTVCGADSMGKQKNAMETIQFLRSLYNTTLTNHIVTKVEYDPTSIKTTGGVSFSNNYATYTLFGKTTRFHSNSDLKITDITATAKEIAHQILKKM